MVINALSVEFLTADSSLPYKSASCSISTHDSIPHPVVNDWVRSLLPIWLYLWSVVLVLRRCVLIALCLLIEAV